MIRFIKYVLKKTGLPPLLQRLKSVFKKRQPFGYDFIFGDITNSCNLKCPHCYNNWDEPFLSQSIFMSKKHLKKIIPLIPLAANHDYHLSCAFEPLLHPEFKELVSMIPFSLQKNVLFTTNLTTNITDGVLQFLSQTNLRYINISVESFMPDIYESCRKNGKFSRFIDNLERLAFYFDKNPRSPPIRFITLASKLNASEIPSIIEKCSVAFHASEHEVRNFYITANNRQWVASHALTATEWDEMEKELSNIPYKYRVYNPLKVAQLPSSSKKHNPRNLRIQSNGIVRIEYEDKNMSFNLDEIEDAYTFFKKELKKLN